METWIQNIETNENEGEDRRTKKKKKKKEKENGHFPEQYTVTYRR